MRSLLRPSPTLWIFLCAVTVCTAFAMFTDHRWEDFYITYRSSRNLVESNGLVFQPGEKVHTFTSPLGVLLPALALQLTGNGSDEGALAIFRIWCIGALGGTAVLLWLTAGAWGWSDFTRVFLALLPLIEPKCVDFTINGMETALMLLWLAWALHTLSKGGSRAALKLGLAWAGLMWTRPDGFVFGGAMAIAWLAFLPTKAAATNRRELVLLFIRAAGIAALAYLPWFLWAWSYYGSPVPNTVLAKGSAAALPALGEWGKILLRQSFLLGWQGRLREIYLPAYAWFGGWPAPLVWWMQAAAGLAGFYWLLPKANRIGRMGSFAFFLSSLYASTVPKEPWYYPCHAFAAMLVLGAAAEDLRLWLERRRMRPLFARLPCIVHVTLSLALLGMVAWQLRQQQSIIEGQRKEIGLWLKAHRSAPTDTVFLEPLGYIGFYSQLRMFDFPGLAAPEVIAAQHKIGGDWTKLIPYLHPDWLVLRRNEAAGMLAHSPDLLTRQYHLVRIFDASATVRAVPWLPGRIYLELDQTFEVFRRSG